MSRLKEYIKKKPELISELKKLIKEYNDERGTYLFVYAAAVEKQIPGVELNESDYYIIHDMLSDTNVKKMDMYVETPGGRGETADEIVRFMRSKFDEVNFVVSGEAKSAGTILVLSGDEIYMTETGSLGPIDAQVKIGRSWQSAYDYIEWVKARRNDARKTGELNAFDAMIVAQITPGELMDVRDALKFSEELVVKWLPRYKFKNWTIRESHGDIVTPTIRTKRAREIAKKLMDHSTWKFHSRSIKIEDLEEIGLKIKKVEDTPKIADIVFKIQTICRLLFDNTSAYKIYANEDDVITKNATPVGDRVGGDSFNVQEMHVPEVILTSSRCEKCGKAYDIYVKLFPDPAIDQDFMSKGYICFPKDGILKCDCGAEIDLSWMKNKVESDTGRKIISQ